jgi:Ankyrin repeats (3 copies)
VHRHTRSNSANALDHRIRIIGDVRLVEHDHRACTALPCDEEITLDAPRIEIPVETANQKHRVDVRGNDLLFGWIACGTPREAAAAWQDGHDPCVATVRRRFERYPVAHRGEIRPRTCVVTDPSGHPREQIAVSRQDAIDVRVFERNPSRDQAALGMDGERGAEVGIPAERPKRIVGWLPLHYKVISARLPGMKTRIAVVVLGCAAALACGGPPRDFTAMAVAARTGDVQRIASLAAAGHDVNAVDAGGNQWTPLLHAIHKGQRGAVDALLAAGADVHRAAGDRRSPGHLTPLLMAVGNGQSDIVRRLLAAGADPRGDGPDIFPTAVAGGALTDIENPLLGHCNVDVVRALLERDPTLRLPRNAHGRLSLMFARLNHCDNVIQLARF